MPAMVTWMRQRSLRVFQQRLPRAGVSVNLLIVYPLKLWNTDQKRLVQMLV